MSSFASVSYSSVIEFAKQSGSSVLTVQRMPASISRRIGCSFIDATTCSPTLLIGLAAGTLRLGGPFHRIVPRPRGYRPLRVATGALHPAGRGLRPIEVTLELLPWSSRWSELALIAGRVRRSDCRRRADRAYLQGAHAAAHGPQVVHVPELAAQGEQEMETGIDVVVRARQAGAVASRCSPIRRCEGVSGCVRAGWA